MANRQISQTSRLVRGHTSTGSQQAEFVTALCVFFLVALFPLINFLGVGLGAATVLLISHQLATHAASQKTNQQALSVVKQDALASMSTGFANFLRLNPAGGYKNCGADLLIQATSFTGGGTQLYGPLPANAPSNVDATKNIYEYVVKTDFNVGPLISMARVPWIAAVPGLGRPFQISLTAARAAEFATGLAAASASKSKSANVLNINTFGNIVPAPPPAGPQPPNVGWRDPNIYAQIQAAGQTIVSQTVVTVVANQPWTNSNLPIGPGLQVWVDTRADGSWSGHPGVLPYTDANGLPSSMDSEVVGSGYALGDTLVYAAAPPCSLIGFVGNTPPLPPEYGGGLSTPGLFASGDTMLNYAPTTSGPIWLRMNDNANSNDLGQQTVRVIITQAG